MITTLKLNYYLFYYTTLILYCHCCYVVIVTPVQFMYSLILLLLLIVCISRKMRSVQQSIILFASFLLVLLLLLIVINDCDGTYLRRNDNYGMSTNMYLWSCPCPSVPPRIIATLLFQTYTYSRVMLVIVLYDSIMYLVETTLYMDESVTTIRDDVISSSVLYVGCDE